MTPDSNRASEGVAEAVGLREAVERLADDLTSQRDYEIHAAIGDELRRILAAHPATPPAEDAACTTCASAPVYVCGHPSDKPAEDAGSEELAMLVLDAMETLGIEDATLSDARVVADSVASHVAAATEKATEGLRGEVDDLTAALRSAEADANAATARAEAAEAATVKARQEGADLREAAIVALIATGRHTSETAEAALNDRADAITRESGEDA